MSIGSTVAIRSRRDKKRRPKGSGRVYFRRDTGRWRAQHEHLGSFEAATKAVAETWLKDGLHRLKREGLGPLSDTPVGELTYGQAWDKYSESLLLQKPSLTAKCHQRAWKRVVAWSRASGISVWRTTRLRNVTTGQIEDYKVWSRGRGYGDSVLRQDLGLLRYLGNWAQNRNLARAPNVRWNLPPPPRRQAEELKRETFDLLLRHANPTQASLLIWYWWTGARPQEAPGILRKDFLPDKGTVAIPTSKTARRTGLSHRTIQLTQEMIDAITARDEWLRCIAASGKAVGGTRPKEAKARLESPWLFPAKTGKRLGQWGHIGVLKSCYASAGVKARDIYAFRHAFATRWLTAGGDIHHLAKHMGTSVREIEATYGHIVSEHVRDVLTRMRST